MVPSKARSTSATRARTIIASGHHGNSARRNNEWTPKTMASKWFVIDFFEITSVVSPKQGYSFKRRRLWL
jgi:hypothetical protein